MSKKMWMVRAGRNAALIRDFEDSKYLAKGEGTFNSLSIPDIIKVF